MDNSMPDFPVHHQTQSLLKLMSIKSVMPFNLILCCPFLLLPSIFLSLRVFSSELALCIRWPKYWNVSISPSSEYSKWISLGLVGFDLLAVRAFCVLGMVLGRPLVADV